MAARMLIFLVVALVLLGSAHYYVWARLVRDAAWAAPSSASWRGATALVVLLYVVMMASFFAQRSSRAIAGPLAWVGFTWLGVLFFLVLSLGLSDLVRVAALGGNRAPALPERRQAVARLFGGIAALVGFGASGAALAGGLAAVGVANVRVVLDKLARGASGYRIVQITDVHVGPTIGKEFIERIVAHVNALQPDLVAITGDLVDGSVAELREHVAPLAKLRARDGVFFVTGNHEYYSGVDAWLAHLGTLGIRVLRNERVALADFDLAGIDDVSSHAPGHGADLGKALAGRDPSRPCVLLAHQPKGIEHADALGVDLQLSGHTHGGQLFPWGLLVRLQQPFVAGLHRLTRAQLYVSKGTGYWGPPMRLGAPSEITVVELHAA
ncbi:MAG: putative phosphoesterase [Labilithrix sp.]|nr:putative phosphoesterase [Labilithrix sp.]